jgi:uncharacterized protein YbaR (Trm112 family)
MAENLYFDASQLDRLACPACLGRFFLGEDRLVCTDCQRAYPIVDGIPVLIAERAEILNSSK